MTNITSETNVEKAILSLLIKGSNPSIEAIRSELAQMFGFDSGEKKGSPNEILKIKREWQEKVRESMSIPEPKHIPKEVLAAFERVWEENLAIASKGFDGERKEYTHAISIIEEEKKFLMDTVEKIKSQLESSKSTIDSKEETIKSLKRENNSLNKEITSLQQTVDALNERSIEVEKFASEEKAKCEKAQDSYSGLMDRYGQLSKQYSDITAKYTELVEGILNQKDSPKK